MTSKMNKVNKTKRNIDKKDKEKKIKLASFIRTNFKNYIDCIALPKYYIYKSKKMIER